MAGVVTSVVTNLVAIAAPEPVTAVLVAGTPPADSVPPGISLAVGTALVSLVVTVVTGWLVDAVVVMAHEGSHALTAAFLGIPVHSIKIGATEGGTYRSSAGALSTVPIKMAGYLGPSAFGLLGCIALAHGRYDVVLWGSVVLLVGLLAFTDNMFGWIAVTLIAVGLAAAAYRPSAPLHVWVGCCWTWVLLMGGLRTAVGHRRGGMDHRSLQEMTLVPAGCWGGVSVLFALATLAFGGFVMTGAVQLGN